MPPLSFGLWASGSFFIALLIFVGESHLSPISTTLAYTNPPVGGTVDSSGTICTTGTISIKSTLALLSTLTSSTIIIASLGSPASHNSTTSANATLTAAENASGTATAVASISFTQVPTSPARPWNNTTTSTTEIGEPKSDKLTARPALKPRPITPSFFYEGEFKAVCVSPKSGTELVKHYTENPDSADIVINNIPKEVWDRTIASWKAKILKAAKRTGGRNYLRRWVAHSLFLCRFCRCDDEGNLAEYTGNEPTKKRGCDADWKVGRCKLLMGCRCEVKLGQNRPTAAQNGATLEDFQRAIDQIPDPVRAAPENQLWTWEVDESRRTHPNHRLGFNQEWVDLAMAAIEQGPNPQPQREESAPPAPPLFGPDGEQQRADGGQQQADGGQQWADGFQGLNDWERNIMHLAEWNRWFDATGGGGAGGSGSGGGHSGGGFFDPPPHRKRNSPSKGDQEAEGSGTAVAVTA
ncbi:hypothetical protein TWF281_010313 [Arthrobotrys megalospora]